jgi:hypothetical protein
MKDHDHISRRRFLQSTGVMTGTSLLRIGAPSLAAIAQAACTARDAEATFQALGTDEAADFAAIAARLIPTTDTPGATEAGVIYFWDNALAGYFAFWLPTVRSLLDDLHTQLGSRFSELSAEDQDAALRSIEADTRFNFWRYLTIFGFFSMAKHGGNKDHLSWDLVGFDGHHGAWAPPFGRYDAEHAQEPFDGE